MITTTLTVDMYPEDIGMEARLGSGPAEYDEGT